VVSRHWRHNRLAHATRQIGGRPCLSRLHGSPRPGPQAHVPTQEPACAKQLQIALNRTRPASDPTLPPDIPLAADARLQGLLQTHIQQASASRGRPIQRQAHTSTPHRWHQAHAASRPHLLTAMAGANRGAQAMACAVGRHQAHEHRNPPSRPMQPDCSTQQAGHPTPRPGSDRKHVKDGAPPPANQHTVPAACSISLACRRSRPTWRPHKNRATGQSTVARLTADFDPGEHTHGTHGQQQPDSGDRVWAYCTISRQNRDTLVARPSGRMAHHTHGAVASGKAQLSQLYGTGLCISWSTTDRRQT